MTDPGAPGESLLTCSGLTVRHGGHVVVSDVDLTVGHGEVVGLIGANGAGKTTTIDAISGFVAHEGRVALEGVDLAHEPPHRRARAGIGRTWQGVELFDDLTVGQNCRLSTPHGGWRGVVADLFGRPVSPDVTAVVDGALNAVGLAHLADRRPSDLSNGQQKLVGVARALAARPRVLLADEPAAGLDDVERVEFGRALRAAVASDGVGVLIVDHDTRLIFDICDRVYVLDFGAVVAVGTAAEVRASPAVIEAYLGVAT
ncbi:MAG: ATP-binding cassette domain-containing protein [Acidimicrobiales bacterium]